MSNKRNSIFRMVLIGFMAALCFAATWIRIPVVLGGFESMIHLGTTAIFITAAILGKDAGLSAGIGLALFDLLDPAYVIWAPFTFIIKGLTGFSAGAICHMNNKHGDNVLYNIIGFLAGGIVSLLGYFVVGIFMYGSAAVAFAHMITSVSTTAIGIAVAIPIAKALKAAMPLNLKQKLNC